uniref:Uncharacterized protein n=1 Tax=Panagrolaimus davidi TaxID=227884 RepID=A0A914QD01_9BILA
MSLRHQGKLLKLVIDSNEKASIINFQRWYCAPLRGKPPPPPKIIPTPGLVESIFHRRGSHQEKEEGEAPDWFKKFEKKMDEFEKVSLFLLEWDKKSKNFYNSNTATSL